MYFFQITSFTFIVFKHSFIGSFSSFQTIVEHSLVHLITNAYKYLKIAFRRLNANAAAIKISLFFISMDFKKCFFSVFVLTSPEFFSINGRPNNPSVQGLEEETY